MVLVDDGLLVPDGADDDIIGDTAVYGGDAVDDAANTDTRNTDDMELDRRDMHINEDRKDDKFLDKGIVNHVQQHL